MKKVVWLLMESERGEHSSAIVFWYGVLEKLGYEVTYYPYEDYEPEKFYSEMLDYKPDYVFHPCYDKLHLELLRLTEFCKVYVVQSDDDWRFEQYSKFYVPFVNGTISYQAERGWYTNLGAKEKQIVSLKWAFNPNTMMLEEYPNRDLFVTHGGSLYGERISLIQRFRDLGVEVSLAYNVKYGELLNLWSRSKYSLCFTRSSNGGFRQKKGRVAEIAFHTVLLSEPFPGIEEYFEPNKEIVIFESVEEAIDKINFYEKNQNAYEEILALGRKRLWNTNTVFHQWDIAMKEIDEDYKGSNIQKILQDYE